jgi:hypothetical protein
MRRIYFAGFTLVVAALFFLWGAAFGTMHIFPYNLWKASGMRSDPDAVYRHQRALFFDHFHQNADIATVGDSITADVSWQEVFPGLSIANRGIKGDTTSGVLGRIPGILAVHPKLVVLLVGTNDVVTDDTVPQIFARYQRIVAALTPHAKVVLVSVMPCGAVLKTCKDTMPKINALNASIKTIPGAQFLDLTPTLSEGGVMKPAYTYDGVHLTVAGFESWKSALEPVFTGFFGDQAKP